MKAKQLETIKAKHKSFLTAGITPKPDDCGCQIKLALISDTPPKLRSHKEIIEAAKKAIVCGDRYDGRKLNLDDVFVTPPNSKLAEWEKAEAARLKRVAAYSKEADRIITRAELHDDSDADEVMAELSAAAEKHGLTLKP